MRGTDGMQESLFTMSKLEDFVPADHPLRPIGVLVNEALARLNGLFNEIYADAGRASIPPEKLMRALLLQVFYSVRSERQVCEQLRYNLLFRWFVGLAIDDAVWDHSVFSKNRDRLLKHAVIEAFFTEIMRLADAKGLLSKEHFSVDGTLIQAWASHKSFRPKEGGNDQTPSGPGRNAQADWKGKPRTNDTHESSTDPDARLFRKSHNTASILCYQGHVLMENRTGLVVGAVVTHADGTGERAAALAMLDTVPGVLSVDEAAAEPGAEGARREDAGQGRRLTRLKELPELLYGKACIASDTAHGECIDGIVSWNGHNALTIAHNDVFSLTHHSEAGLFESAHGVQMIDARDLRQAKRLLRLRGYPRPLAAH